MDYPFLHFHCQQTSLKSPLYPILLRPSKPSVKCNTTIVFIQWPERIYQSLHGVTAVDFSIGAPNLLAVGYYNGTIAVYNVQSNSNVPVLDSR